MIRPDIGGRHICLFSLVGGKPGVDVVEEAAVEEPQEHTERAPLHHSSLVLTVTIPAYTRTTGANYTLSIAS